MKRIKVNEFLPAAFVGWWSGMVLFVFIARSEAWAIVGGFVGAAIQVYTELREKRKKESVK